MHRKHHLLCLIILLLPVLLIRAPAQTVTPRATGLLDLPIAEKERILGNFQVWEASPTREALPARVVNTQYLPKVGSQGALGICGSYVIYYYLYSYYFAKVRGLAERPDPATTPQYVFSPAWGVLMAPHGNQPEGDGLTMPWGSYPLSCIESILKIGSLTWADMPYSDDEGKEPEDKFYRQLPTAEQMKTALQYKGVRGSLLNAIDTPDGLENLKLFLSQGNIAVAIWNSPLTTNFDTYPNPSEYVNIDGIGDIGNVNNDVYAWSSEESGRNPGHAVTIVGYDDNITYRNKSGEECQGALLIVNSWGTGWGISPQEGIESGFMWLGYEVVLEDKKLSGQVYSIGARSENYQTQLLGTFELQDLTANNWLTQIMGYPVRWPSLLEVSASGRPLQIDFPSNLYITKSNTPQQDLAEYLFDLSSMANAFFPALTLQTSLVTPDAVGKVSGVQITRRQQEGEAWTETESPVPDVDFTVQRFSSSYPSFSATIAMLQQRDIGLNDLHPQAGSGAWGDANGDGLPDLAIASVQKKADGTLENIHRVYLNNAAGGFLEPPVELTIPDNELARSGLCELLWVDIDNDGDLDIVASNEYATYLFTNNSQAVFTLSETLPYPGGPGTIATADFDLDGRPDLAITSSDTTGTVILFQTSPGAFTPYPIGLRGSDNVAMGILAPAMAVGDINGDGLPDLVASGKESGGSQSLVWYQNNGDYTFTPRLLPLPALPHFSIAIADFNGDGCDDILYSAGSNNGMHLNGVLQGKTEGMPAPVTMPDALPPLWGGRVLWADLNNDGRLEAVISGIENNGFSSYSFDYGELDRYPRDQYYKHYTRVLIWDSEELQFQDSGMTLPSTVGFAGPSILSATDFDNDGDVDLLSGGVLTSKANFFAAQGPDIDLCSMIFLENRARGYFGDERVNAPPAAPTGLAADALGSGKVTFSWNASADDSTPAGVLRYVLQAGTAPGQYNLCSGLQPETLQGSLLQPPLTMRLPDGTIHWRVRAIDAGGRMSDWSTEQSIVCSGSEIPPAPGAPLPELALPQVSVTVQSLDSNGGTAGGYVLGGGGASAGSTILLKAFPRAGWRFSHWEGEVYSPLARKTKMLVFSDAAVVARFVPDRDLLHTASTHTALRDRNGHVWAWSDTFSEARTGASWLQAQDGLPALSAACSQAATWLAINDTRTFFGVSKGEYDNSADNEKNFLRDSLMTIAGLDGFSWWPYPAYPEKTLAFWAAGNSYIANHLGTYTMEWDNITFGGSVASIYPYVSWTVSQHDPNQINPGITQVACTDTFVLFLTHQAGIYAVGSNHCGQLGDNSTNEFTDIAPVSGMPEFKAIAAGEDSGSQTAFALGLDFQGRVWSWGNNDYGQLGLGYHGPGTGVLSPQILPPFPSPVIALATGKRHALALTEDGQVFAWGENGSGQAGVGDGNGDGVLDQQIVDSPYAVPGLGNVFCIAAAAGHSLAMNDGGELFGWGNNGSGQINGQSSADLWSPTLVPNAPKWEGSASTLTTSVRSDADTPGTSTPYLGMGSVTPPAGLRAARTGSTLQIEAVDGERYQFSHWEGPVADPNNPVTTILIGEGNIQVCAVFTLFDEPVLTIAADPETAGSTLPAPGEYALSQNSLHTFQALPKPQFVFREWDSVTDLGEFAQQSQFDWTLTSDLNLTALFEARPFRTVPKPNIGGSTLSLTENGQIIWWTGNTSADKHILDLGGVWIVDVVGDGLALGNNGRLYAWGSNTCGERGEGTASSDYTSPDEYNLVLGPDGQEVFSDAVRIFTCGYSRFALSADGNLYYWGKTLLSDLVHTRPRRLYGLKDNAHLVDIACSSGSTWIDDGSLLGKTIVFSAYYFLYDDGTVASWGDPELTGTGQTHDSPVLIPGLNDIQAVAASSGIALALRQNGTVLTWGKCNPDNYQGNLGLGENQTSQLTPTPLPGLENITRIFVVNQSCFAVNQLGKLHIWGQNGSWWWMGVGTDGPESYFTPALHPDVTLPEFIFIAGGGSHIVALTTAGELWKWGRNAFEYNRIQYQQWNWPNAVRDGTFGTYSVIPFTYRRIQLHYDLRADGLVSYPAGVYTLLDGDTITLHAASSTGMDFQEWRKDGVLFSQSPFLEFAVNENFSLEAVYAIQAPVLELGDGSADAGGVATLPLFLSEANAGYEAVDLVLRFPDSLQFRGIDSEGTQLQEGFIATYWSLPGQNTRDGLAEVRINIRQTGELFAAGDIPLAKLLFKLPWLDTQSYTVSMDLVTNTAVLSRQYGAFADTAEGNAAQISLNDGMIQEFSSGWLYFTPFGELPYDSLTAWSDAMASNGIDFNPVAWVWNSTRNCWENNPELLPNQPMLLYVERSGYSHLEIDDAPFSTTLLPGWNLLTVPQELQAPADAVIIFAIGETCCEIYSYETLQPGTLYWIFRNADAPMTGYPPF